MFRILAVLLVLASSACVQTRYVAQAGMGQLDLFRRARPLREVLADPATSERTRVLLSEVDPVKRFARARGLKTKGNYESYVALNRNAVVWFTAAAPKLSLEPVTWSFPLVGSFPYLGWFEYQEALRFRKSLESDGYDTYLRTVSAYSTGGWFTDPVLSTMLRPGPAGLRRLVNVLFHELTHANVIINDQSVFNESIASFVGDTMAEQYLVARFGKGSSELVDYRAELDEDAKRVQRLVRAYRELETVYASSASKTRKLARKKKLLGALRVELELPFEPNNAFLLGFKTYNSGLKEFAQLLSACDGDWLRFFARIRTLNGDSFAKEQEENIGPIIGKLAKAGCSASSRSRRAAQLTR